jgi:FixJ family two-component response regulator
MEPMPGFGLVIAIVDDEECVRKALERLLRSVGHEVVSFRSGEDFLYSLEILGLDCTILDLHLPGLSGLEVQHCLRRNHNSLPCIIITGKDEPGTRERVIASGARGYLTKPFDARALLELIAEAVQVSGQSPTENGRRSATHDAGRRIGQAYQARPEKSLSVA